MPSDTPSRPRLTPAGGPFRFHQAEPGVQSPVLPPAFVLGGWRDTIARMYFGDIAILPVGSYVVPGGAVTSHGLVQSEGRILLCDQLNVSDASIAEAALYGAVLEGRTPTRVVDGAAVVLAGPGHLIYGHWLVDFLPKLHILQRLGLDVAAQRYLLPSNTPGFALDWLRLTGLRDEQFIFFHPYEEVVGADELIVPTLLRTSSRAHPAFGDAARFVLELVQRRHAVPVAGPGASRIFVSRAGAGRDGRFMVNRNAVEQMAVDAGMTAVRPETMPILDQIALFRGARQIAGEYGSGLHGSMFSEPGTAVCAFRAAAAHPGFLQSGLCQAMGQTIGYVLGDAPDDAVEQAFTVADPDVRTALHLLAITPWREPGHPDAAPAAALAAALSALEAQMAQRERDHRREREASEQRLSEAHEQLRSAVASIPTVQEMADRVRQSDARQAIARQSAAELRKQVGELQGRVAALQAALAGAERQAAEGRRAAANAHAHAAQASHRAAEEVRAAQRSAAQAVEHARAELQTQHDRARSEVAAAQARAANAERQAAAMMAVRDEVLGSTVWKASAPLRRLATGSPGARRVVRRSAKLAWYLATFQHRRVVTRLRRPPPVPVLPAQPERAMPAETPTPALPAPALPAPALPAPILPAPTLPAPLSFDAEPVFLPPPPGPEAGAAWAGPPGWPTPEDKAGAARQALGELRAFLHSDQRITFATVPEPAVSVVVVLWNAAELTLRCLLALQAHAGPVEVVLFDNGSADDTGALLARVDGAVVVRNGGNAGFVAGCNRGVAASRGRTVLLLNSDAFVRPGAVAAALATLDSSADIGAVGARIVLPDGSLQEAGSIIWSDGSSLGYGRGQLPEWFGGMFRRDVDYCSGAFLLTRRTTWDDGGGLDERYSPAYYEEADFCMRLRERGLRVVYEPSAVIDHFEFGSQAAEGAMHSLSIRNRKLFRARHAAQLNSRHLPCAGINILAGRERLRPGQRRLLVIDNLVPLGVAGSGYPRAREMLAEAVRLGWAVTMYCSSRPSIDWAEARREIPPEIEVVAGDGAPELLPFLTERAGHYDAVVVSRPNNMATLQGIAASDGRLLWGVRLLYDAEALFTAREVLEAQLAGKPLSPEAAEASLDSEIRLAEGADAVACVSPGEARAFECRLKTPVRVLSYVGTVRGDTPEFGQRLGLLFVGRLLEKQAPNWEGLSWFVREVWPLLRAAVPHATLSVAGQLHPELAELTGPGIELLGPQADLAPIYDRARVFISPVRYAAGIPLKIIDATFAGVPCAGTTLMAELMDWQPGVQMAAADDPEALALAIAELHENPVLWRGIRAASAADAAARFNPGEFRRTLAGLLDG